MEAPLAWFATRSADELYRRIKGADAAALLGETLGADAPRVRAAMLQLIDRAVAVAHGELESGAGSGRAARWLYELVAGIMNVGGAIAARLDDLEEVVAVAAADALGQLAFAGANGLVRGPEYKARRAWLMAETAASADALVRASAAAPPGLRAAATWALGQIAGVDEDGLAARLGDVLAARLRDDDAAVRAIAARALVRRAAGAAVAAVIALHTDRDVGVRDVALAHASRHHDASVAPALLARLRDLLATELPRQSVLAPRRRARHEEPTSAYDVVSWVCRLGLPEARAPLLALLAAPGDPDLPMTIVDALMEIADETCVDALCGLLPARDMTSCRAAAALGRLRAAGAADGLVAMLDGPSAIAHIPTQVQAAAARALASIGARDRAGDLEAVLDRAATEPHARGPLLEALVRLGAPSAPTRARRALDEAGPGDAAAARALGRCGDAGDLERLRHALTARSPYVRAGAVVSLATLSHAPDALAALGRAADDGPIVHDVEDLIDLIHAWIALVDRNAAARSFAAGFIARAEWILDDADRNHRGLGSVSGFGYGYVFEARDALVTLVAGCAVSSDPR